MGRYGDINRAEELKAAKDKLDLWLKMSRAEKQAAFAATQAATGNKRSNVGRVTAWIQPFGAPDKFFYETYIPAAPSGNPTAKEENANTIITKVANAVKAENRAVIVEPTGAGIIIEKARKIEFAKVIYSQIGGTVSGVVSRITGIPYSYTKTDSVSSSFGQGTTAPVPSEGTAQAQLRAALLAAATGNERVSFKPQGDVSIRAASV